MDIVEQYRKFADECRKLAQCSGVSDKTILLEIAKAWDERAEIEMQKLIVHARRAS